MPPFDRRDLFNGAVAGVATVALSKSGIAQDKGAADRRSWQIVDTNVNLFQWPFRRLPLDTIDELLKKMRSLSIARAWAGSFEGLLHRDVSGVNSRLAEACAKEGNGMLVPFGTVNLQLPDWEENLRRCQEEHRMPGIRLHPNYHGYTLVDSRFQRLLSMSAERGLLVQLAAAMEDRRTQHPLAQVPDVDLAPIPAVVKKVPRANVMILNYRPAGAVFAELAKTPRVYFDIARVEATDGVARIIRSVPAGRVVFGTHAPFLVYESALIKVYESELTEKETLAILQQNAQRLL